MVLLENWLDLIWDVLDHFLDHSSHLKVKVGLLILAVELLIQLLLVHPGLLGLGLFLVDFHSDIVIVKFDIFLDNSFVIGEACLHFLTEFEVEIWLQISKVNEIVLGLAIGIFQLQLDLLLKQSTGLIHLILLGILFAQQIVSLKHEDHLLLWFLKKTCEFHSDLLSKLVKLLVFLVNQFDQLIHFLLEIVERLSHKDSFSQIGQYILNGGFHGLL